MAIINYTDQLKYTGKGYLDAKMMPVNTVDDLKAISLTQRFEGFTVTVLNDGNPQDYWLVGGITNKCWVPKTNANDYKDLKLVLEEGFLKLLNGEDELGESINLNDFFPEKPEDDDPSFDLYIDSVEYCTVNGEGEEGVFLRFNYSDSSVKYLDMSHFLSKTYEPGSGIVIDGNVISLDAAILGRIEFLETEIQHTKKSLEEEIIERKKAIDSIQEKLNKLANLQDDIKSNTDNINELRSDINILEERVNAISSIGEGLTPDGETIGISNDETKSLFVKILNKEGNILKKDKNENGESGLYATIPIFLEDEEL